MIWLILGITFVTLLGFIIAIALLSIFGALVLSNSAEDFGKYLDHLLGIKEKLFPTKMDLVENNVVPELDKVTESLTQEDLLAQEINLAAIEHMKSTINCI